MTHYEFEIDIDAPINYVFEWGTDPDNQVRCTPSLIGVEIIEETEEGLRVRNTMKLLGRTTTGEELYKIDTDNKQTTSILDDGDMSGEMVFEYTETDTGTNVRMVGDMEFGTSLFDRAIQPVVTRYMKRQFRNTLKTMKELIEAEHAVERDAQTGAIRR